MSNSCCLMFISKAGRTVVKRKKSSRYYVLIWCFAYAFTLQLNVEGLTFLFALKYFYHELY